MADERHADDPISESSAGGVVYRRRGDALEILLGHQTDWNTGASNVRLPKGHIDPGETLEQAAVREVREETGRLARIRHRLGETRYEFVDHRNGRRIDKRVVYYLMEDEGPAPEQRDQEMEEIEWAPATRAAGQLSFENEREVVRRAIEQLSQAE